MCRHSVSFLVDAYEGTVQLDTNKTSAFRIEENAVEKITMVHPSLELSEYYEITGKFSGFNDRVLKILKCSNNMSLQMPFCLSLI